MSTHRSDVVIIGGGPSGLSAAIALKQAGAGNVTVLEREAAAGGVPRHTDHLGFGMRDVHRMLSGPAYARRLVGAAEHAGVDVRTATTVTALDGAGVTLADGSRLTAGAVLLATGVRERPRAARLVPGDRPAGVFTTGALQQFVMAGLPVGNRAVIVGAEHVSFSAVLTLRHAHCDPVAMLTDLPRHQTYAPLRVATATRHRVPLRTGVGIAAIIGHRRVAAVELTDGGRIECDTVVFTGDWIPDHELARRAGLPMVPVAKSPVVDRSFRTAQPGVFAIGNLVHPAETADVCARDGRAVAAAVIEHLRGEPWPTALAAIDVAPPLRWAAPTAMGLTVRVADVVTGRLQVLGGDTTLWTSRRRQWIPNRAIHLGRLAAAATAVRLVP